MRVDGHGYEYKIDKFGPLFSCGLQRLRCGAIHEYRFYAKCNKIHLDTASTYCAIAINLAAITRAGIAIDACKRLGAAGVEMRGSSCEIEGIGVVYTHEHN